MTLFDQLKLLINLCFQDGGRQLYLGILDNGTLVKLDLHLTGVGVDNEYHIEQKLNINKNKFNLFLDQ